jgi:putative oxidoreductase
MDTASRPLPALGRIFLALIFVLAGLNKLGASGATASYMAGHGIPWPNLLVYGAIVVELGVGLMLMAGLYARGAALVLFCYTLALALIFHPYWAMPPEAQRTEHAMFFEHLAIMGGLLYVVAFGAGAWSVDAVWRPAAAPLLAYAGDKPRRHS